jgi:hypothetical protein
LGKLLLAFASTAILGSKFHGTHDHIYLSWLWWAFGRCYIALAIDVVLEVTSWLDEHSRCLPLPYLRMETDPVSETLCFLVSRIPDKWQRTKPSNSEYYTQSSELFRIYKNNVVY